MTNSAIANLKYGNETPVSGLLDIKFEYEVGHRLHSNKPRCYQGVYMPPATPTCDFSCKGKECFLKGPAPPNVGKRMLVGSDGRPDVTPPTPGEFEKRFLQKLAGPDVKAAEYTIDVSKAYDALNIPTRIINTNQYYLPGIKLDQILKGMVNDIVDGGVGLRRRMLETASVIEGEISNGKASLSTQLQQQTETAYEFTVQDKLRQDAAPPAAIKIEKLPKHGKILITEHDGSTRAL